MKTNSAPSLSRQLLRWSPLLIVLILFFYGMALRNSVPSVSQDSSDVVETISYLNSVDTLKTMITTLNRQIQWAEKEWSSALSMMLLALFLVAGVAVAVWVQLLQAQKRIDELEALADKERN